MIIRFVSLLATCFALHVVVAPAHAQREPSQTLEQVPRPMPARTQVKLAAAGVGGALVGAAGAATTGLAAGLFTYINEDEDSLRIGLTVGIITALAVACVAMPIASSLFVHHSGRKLGYRGRYGYALLGAGAGISVGVALGLALSAWKPDEITAISAIASTVGAASTAVLAMVAYRISDQRRARLSPVVGLNAERAQLSIGVRGRF